MVGDFTAQPTTALIVVDRLLACVWAFFHSRFLFSLDAGKLGWPRVEHSCHCVPGGLVQCAYRFAVLLPQAPGRDGVSNKQPARSTRCAGHKQHAFHPFFSRAAAYSQPVLCPSPLAFSLFVSINFN